MLNGQLDVYASHDIRRPDAKEESGACISNSKQFMRFWDAGQIASPPLGAHSYCSYVASYGCI